MLKRLFCLTIVILATAVAASAQKRTTAVKTGPWSGENAHVIVDKSSVTLDFGCTSGRISTRLRIDRRGNFRASGTYTSGIGGANPAPGMKPRDEQVIYTGTVKGNKMTVTIDFPNSERQSPSYELKKGALMRDIPRCG